MKRWVDWLVLLLLFLAAAPAGFAAGLIIVDDAHWWPGPPPPHPIPPWPHPFPRPHPYVFAPLEITFVKAHTRVNDQVALTSIDEEFENPNPSRLEGTFVFPVPKGAHIDKFSMEIDGKQVEAELLSAEKARHIYEEIVRKLKDPALLEYAGQDMFKVRIFPIEPHSKKRVKLSYTQLLNADEGLVNYTLPLNTSKFSARPIKQVSVKIEIESQRPLKSIYSPTHSVEVKREGPHRATVGYEASNVQPDTDLALYFAPEKDELGVNLLAHRTGEGDGYFLLLAAPGVDVKQLHVLRKDVAFVLDTSGSMAGKKLEQAKKALQFCVENLNEEDRFEIIRFSTEVEPLFDKLVSAGRDNRHKAENFIKDLKPTGGTAIDDALKKALALHPPGVAGEARIFVVVFLTDGRPTIGTTDETEIVSDVKKYDDGRTRVFCFGIGTDVNTHLLDKITETTRAFSQYVLPEEDLEMKVSSFFSKIKEPVLADPKLKFSGDIHPAKLYPAPLPDLFKGQQVVVLGRYSGQGDSAAILEGEVNGSSKTFTYEVRFPEENSQNEFIPRLWATRRVGYLLDEIRLHGESSELRDEVTDLARKYGIVTPYTAYLIVEDEAHRNVPVPMRSFREFDQDRAARQQAAEAWGGFQKEKAGAGAVADAQLGMALRSAVAPNEASPAASAAFARRYGIAPSSGAPANTAPTAEERLLQYSQQSRFVCGKNFFLNGQEWVDAEIQKHPDTRRVRIQFASKEYFDLVTNQPKARAWLALGQNVEFLSDNTIYEIYE